MQTLDQLEVVLRRQTLDVHVHLLQSLETGDNLLLPELCLLPQLVSLLAVIARLVAPIEVPRSRVESILVPRLLIHEPPLPGRSDLKLLTLTHLGIMRGCVVFLGLEGILVLVLASLVILLVALHLISFLLTN